MRRRAADAVIAVAAATAVLSLATPASAGSVCSATGRCGRVIHDSRSQAGTLLVTDDWAVGQGWGRREDVRRGREASFRDDDGFWVPPGWYWRMSEPTATAFGGWTPWRKAGRQGHWQKVSDLETRRVSLVLR